MAIKYPKYKPSDKRRVYDKEYHHDRRLNRRLRILEKLGGECMQCGTKEELWFWYTWKEEDRGMVPHQALHRSDEAADAINLNRYHLLCRKHWRERKREETPKRQHGVASTYAGSGRTPCRCAPCTAAWNEYTKKWHRQRNLKRSAARKLLKDEAFRRMFKN